MGTIAAQVRTWRVRRGLTQQQFADALGRHVTWVKKFEAGDRQADPRLSLLVQIAQVLDVTLDVLLGQSDTAAGSRASAMSSGDLRAALLSPVAHDRPQNNQALNRRVAHGYLAYQASNYQDLQRLLPGLLADARSTAATNPGEPSTTHVLAETYHLISITLMKLGDPDAAWHAADQALATAETLDDPVTAALCGQALTWAATGIGHGATGAAIAQAVLDRHAATLATRDEEGWTAIGMTQLKAAVAAADTGNLTLTRHMLAEARVSADHVRPDANIRLTGFNATNVLLYEASVLAQLGEHLAALNAAERIHPAALTALPRERRTHHLVDTAGSAQAAGRTDQALRMLLDAEQISPQEVHTLPAARTVIKALVHARRGPSGGSGLRELARRAGVPA
ncbi:helix-turn-helix domain-containing protein [Pseudofrankia inefficax]|nr:helix-turn-helix transcriptional regulator [Pseudofrankia inefficax]